MCRKHSQEHNLSTYICMYVHVIHVHKCNVIMVLIFYRLLAQIVKMYSNMYVHVHNNFIRV